MASRTKIAEMIATIKAIYPYYAKDNNIEITAKVWEMVLSDFPDNIVEVAFLKCIQTCKMPPTPADVTEKIRAMAELCKETDEELWHIYTKALSKTATQMYYFQFTFREQNGKTQGENAREKVTSIWNGLPERIKQYIGSEGELMRMARDTTDEELKFEKTRFLKTLPTIKEREKYVDLKPLIEENFNNSNQPLIEG
jgi:hypothetical protein